MSFNKLSDIDIISCSDKDYLSFISKKNKIQDEIKDFVINRFIKKICEQHREIIKLNKKLEEIIKKSLLIIKKTLLKKNFVPEKQINFSYIKNFDKVNEEKKNKNENLLLKTIPYLGNKKIYKYNTNTIINFKKVNIKKYLRPKQRNKINNKLIKYTKSLDNSNNDYNYNSRNYYNKGMENIPEKDYETFFLENKNKIESINTGNIKRHINGNSLEINNGLKKLILIEDRNNKIYAQNSFCRENFTNSLEDLYKNIGKKQNKGKNKLKLLNIINKTNKSSNLKKLNLSTILINNNHNWINNINNYKTERTLSNIEKSIDNNILTNKDIFSYSQSKNNKIDNYENKIKHNSMPKNKRKTINKLNKVILKMKEINKHYIPELQNLNQKTEKIRKKININDIKTINISNYLPMTERFFNNQIKTENKTKPNKLIIKDKVIKCLDENKTINFINSNIKYIKYNQNEKQFQTIYNPTFTSFLNRKNQVANSNLKEKIISLNNGIKL